MSIEQFNPMSPGDFIKQVYILEIGRNPKELAEDLEIDINTLNSLLDANLAVTPELAMSLSKVLGRSSESWLAMQEIYRGWKNSNNES